MVFTGEYEHTIDSKNRISIPSEIRALMRAERGGDGSDTLIFYVTLGESGSLCLYSEKGFCERAEELKNSNATPDFLLAFEGLWFSLARRVEIDSAGRLRLPENLLKRRDLGSQVVLLGMNDHVEIRSRDIWQQYVDQALVDHGKILVNPRRAARAGGQDP